jgi:hypothetical protein
MRALPIPISRHGSPTWASWRFQVLPPSSESSSRRKLRSGARWSSSQASKRTDRPLTSSAYRRCQAARFKLVAAGSCIKRRVWASGPPSIGRPGSELEQAPRLVERSELARAVLEIGSMVIPAASAGLPGGYVIIRRI